MSTRIPRILFFAIFAVAVVGMGIIWIFCPPHADDFWYGGEYRENILNGLQPLQAVWAVISSHATYDTARLANAFATLLIPLDMPIIGRLIIAVSWAIMLWFLCKIGGISSHQPLSLGLLVIGLLVLLPWNEFMFCTIFAFNYIVTSAIALPAIWLFYKLDSLSKPRYALALTLSLVTGFFHEGFAACMIAGFVGFMILNGFTRRRVWMTLVLLPGILLFSIVPIIVRLGKSYSDQGLIHALASRTYPILLGLIVIIAFVAYVYGFRKSDLKPLASRLSLFIGVGLVSMMYHVMFESRLRSGWLGDSFVILGIIMIAKGLVKSPPRWLSLSGACLALALLLVHFTATTAETIRVNRYFTPAMERYLSQASDDIVFADIPPESTVSIASIGRPSLSIVYSAYTMGILSYYKNPADTVKSTIVPKALMDIDVNPGEKVPGENDFYRKGGWLYTHNLEDSDFRNCIVETSQGPRRINFQQIKVATPAGTVFSVLYPMMAFPTAVDIDKAESITALN